MEQIHLSFSQLPLHSDSLQGYIFSLTKKVRDSKIRGAPGRVEKTPIWQKKRQSSNCLKIAFDKGLVAQKREWSIWGKNRPFASRDRSQCVTCDHSQESAVNVILLQNFPENLLIIIAFSICKHCLRPCQLCEEQNIDEHNRARTSTMLQEKSYVAGQNGPIIIDFLGESKTLLQLFFYCTQTLASGVMMFHWSQRLWNTWSTFYHWYFQYAS